MNPIEFVDSVVEKYSDEISNSIARTSVHRGAARALPVRVAVQSWDLVPLDSVTAAFMFAERKPCILNFASYKHPGGGFLKGMTTQEESLCAVSTLYPVIAHFKDFYSTNQTMLNNAMYTNAALFSEDILFFADEGSVSKFDVLTCAAPNFGPGKRYKSVTESENYKYLEERIKFMFAVASANGVRCLIAGAWGCGVFKQDPRDVAKLMAYYGRRSGVEKIVFAIPDYNSYNYKAFEDVLSREGLLG